jgi:hypothetical protein
MWFLNPLEIHKVIQGGLMKKVIVGGFVVCQSSMKPDVIVYPVYQEMDGPAVFVWFVITGT